MECLMRKSASEIIRNLEQRIAHLEKQSFLDFGFKLRGINIEPVFPNRPGSRTRTEDMEWRSVKELIGDVQDMFDTYSSENFWHSVEDIPAVIAWDYIEQPLHKMGNVVVFGNPKMGNARIVRMDDLLKGYNLEDQGFKENKRELDHLLKKELRGVAIGLRM